MASIALGGTSVLECPACDGLWVDAGSFERICADRESQAAVLHRRDGRAQTIAHRVSYRPCVACGTMMNRVNFSRISGVVIDVCRKHGTFLDAGELHRTVTFIQEGGLERARQRQIEDLRDERNRLRMQEARAHRLAGRGNDGSWPAEAAGMTLDFSDLLSLFSGD
jgi:Zn-finger nucleic acid-binding protein